MNSGGSTVNSGYYSGNFTHHIGVIDLLVLVQMTFAAQGYIVVRSPSTASMYADLYYVPEDGHMFGFIRYHDQSTQLGVSVIL